RPSIPPAATASSSHAASDGTHHPGERAREVAAHEYVEDGWWNDRREGSNHDERIRNARIPVEAAERDRNRQARGGAEPHQGKEMVLPGENDLNQREGEHAVPDKGNERPEHAVLRRALRSRDIGQLPRDAAEGLDEEQQADAGHGAGEDGGRQRIDQVK